MTADFPDIESRTRSLAITVFDQFCRGLEGDDTALAEFIDGSHDDVIVYFPQGPNLGGPYTKAQLPEFFGFGREFYPTGLFITLDRLFIAGDTAAFQIHDEATTASGDEYRGTVFLSFQFKEGKLWRYREYFGLRWNNVQPFP